MRYVRSYSDYVGETKSHRDRASFCGNTVNHWLSADFEPGSPDSGSVLLPLDQMLPLMN